LIYFVPCTVRFFCLILLFYSASLLAQNNRNNVFTLKPAFGLNGCQIHGDSYSGYDKLGLFAGVGVNARINEKTSFELGFYFSQKGARHNPNPKIGDYSFYRVNLNYIDLPLSLRYQVNPKYFITLGPAIAYLFSFNENVNYTNVTNMYTFNKLETGLNIGLGRKIADKFYVEVRCSNSIKPIRNYGIAGTLIPYPNAIARFFNKGLYNNILTFFIAYKLDLSRRITNE
jgi:hypothetical protein